MLEWSAKNVIANYNFTVHVPYIIGDASIQFAIPVCYKFLKVVHWHRISISNGFWEICIQIYLNHDLDLSLSRDVTSQVTQMPFPIGALL